MELRITIWGPPCAQGRPRFTTIGGHPKAYDPQKSKNYKAYVRLTAIEAARKQGWLLNTDLPLKISIGAYMPVPAAKPKKWKESALQEKIRPTTKPDVDNIFKCITDALSGTVYKDDKQIVQAEIAKNYCSPEKTRVEVSIVALDMA